MKVLHFIYNDQAVDFIPAQNNNVMVNATQMAKIFDKRISFFLKADHVENFISALELSPFGDRSTPLKREEIIKTVNGVNTWMHRILALKFAAWLDPFFEVWVYSTIDEILMGHYNDHKQATIDQLLAKKELERKRQELINTHPELFNELFDIESRIQAADRRKTASIKSAVAQLKLDLFKAEFN